MAIGLPCTPLAAWRVERGGIQLQPHASPSSGLLRLPCSREPRSFGRLTTQEGALAVARRPVRGPYPTCWTFL